MDVGFVRLTDWNWIIYSSPKEHSEMELVWLGWYNACLNSEVINLGKLIDLFGNLTKVVSHSLSELFLNADDGNSLT